MGDLRLFQYEAWLIDSHERHFLKTGKVFAPTARSASKQVYAYYKKKHNDIEIDKNDISITEMEEGCVIQDML